MLRSLWNDFTDLGPVGWAVGVFLLACVVLIVAVIVGQVVNYQTGSKYEYGTVMRLRYHPAYTTVQTVSNGKSTTSVPVYHPAAWTATLRGEGGIKQEEFTVDIDETTYHTWKRGERVENPLWRGDE